MSARNVAITKPLPPSSGKASRLPPLSPRSIGPNLLRTTVEKHAGGQTPSCEVQTHLHAKSRSPKSSRGIESTEKNPISCSTLQKPMARRLIDSKLVGRFQSGDLQAFTPLVEHYRPIILRYISRMIQDRHMAQDLCQEVFLRIYQNLRGLGEAKVFRAWMFRIALNITVDWIRHSSKEVSSIEDMNDCVERTSPHPLSLSKLLPPEDLSPRDSLLHLTSQALARLPEPTRRTIAARYLRGLSCREVAHEMGWSIGNVKVRLHRGRETIRSRVLEQNHRVEDVVSGFRVSPCEAPLVRRRF